jgi:myo-inositol-1(or 4)-monophosphatase
VGHDVGESRELDDALGVAQDLGRWAIETIGAHQLEPAEIDTKTNPSDYVTVVDRVVEQRVRETISARFPGDRVVGEEMGDGGDPSGSTGRVWYVDPVDGTTNFVFGLPWASFSLAMVDADGIAVGVVADPYRGEILSAIRGRGAAVNGRAARCGDRDDLTGGLVLTELAAFRLWDGMAEMTAELAALGTTTRIMGSSALTLANAGVGRASGAVLGGFHTWDVAASVLIAREAGAVVLGRDGGPAAELPDHTHGGILVAAPSVARRLWSAWTQQQAQEPTHSPPAEDPAAAAPSNRRAG